MIKTKTSAASASQVNKRKTLKISSFSLPKKARPNIIAINTKLITSLNIAPGGKGRILLNQELRYGDIRLTASSNDMRFVYIIYQKLSIPIIKLNAKPWCSAVSLPNKFNQSIISTTFQNISQQRMCIKKWFIIETHTSEFINHLQIR
ncbi:hypothetical protein SAMN05192562_104271 [Kosakonia arachidis]|uniref:Uncharacterized protein n=1 Tax=Kosakonia arachidis TaxID=551989 RepID=A0A1I7D164_9ENTR|nr:hypothetical protein SAMN05192562_104271 [Kosakonia arachidis]